MKKFYFLAAAMLLGAGAYAQTDLTPDRFKFANQPEGEFTINYYHGGANPNAALQLPAVEEADAGCLIVCGGPGVIAPQNEAETAPSTANAQTLKKYTTIVDLGGEVGKVLCVKGPNCSAVDFGPEVDASAGYGWWNANFYSKATGAEALTTTRLRLVYKIIGSTELASDIFTLQMQTTQNNFANDATGEAKTAEIKGYFSPDYFYQLDEYDEIVYDEDGVTPLFDESKWMVYEIDFQVPDAGGIPVRAKVGFVAGAKDWTVLFKEVTYTANPTGDPVQGEVVEYEMGGEGVSIEEIINGGEAAFTVAGDQVSFNEAGNVYSISGVQVADAVAGETITLDRGIYVVKAGNKAEKLIVK